VGETLNRLDRTLIVATGSVAEMSAPKIREVITSVSEEVLLNESTLPLFVRTGEKKERIYRRIT
jgi:hypothetical protein